MPNYSLNLRGEPGLNAHPAPIPLVAENDDEALAKAKKHLRITGELTLAAFKRAGGKCVVRGNEGRPSPILSDE